MWETVKIYVKGAADCMDTILFDLDGTLLPMDQDQFMMAYFKELAKKLAPLGFEQKSLIEGVLKGTNAMVANDGAATNNQLFWNSFTDDFGELAQKHQKDFDTFYEVEFQRVKQVTKENPLAKACIDALKEKGYTLAIATNPIFPRVATLSRIKWIGLEPEDFSLITTYEDSCFCKPNLAYYQLILNYLKKDADQCMMVGNDVTEDMCAKELGMEVYLVNDCLINKEERDISLLPQGTFAQFYELVHELPGKN